MNNVMLSGVCLSNICDMYTCEVGVYANINGVEQSIDFVTFMANYNDQGLYSMQYERNFEIDFPVLMYNGVDVREYVNQGVVKGIYLPYDEQMANYIQNTVSTVKGYLEQTNQIQTQEIPQDVSQEPIVIKEETEETQQKTQTETQQVTQDGSPTTALSFGGSAVKESEPTQQTTQVEQETTPQSEVIENVSDDEDDKVTLGEGAKVYCEVGSALDNLHQKGYDNDFILEAATSPSLESAPTEIKDTFISVFEKYLPEENIHRLYDALSSRDIVYVLGINDEHLTGGIDYLKIISKATDMNYTEKENQYKETKLTTIYVNTCLGKAEIVCLDEDSDSNTFTITSLTRKEHAIKNISSKIIDEILTTITQNNCTLMDILEGRQKLITGTIAKYLKMKDNELECKLNPHSIEFSYLKTNISLAVLSGIFNESQAIYDNAYEQKTEITLREWRRLSQTDKINLITNPIEFNGVKYKTSRFFSQDLNVALSNFLTNNGYDTDDKGLDELVLEVSKDYPYDLIGEGLVGGDKITIFNLITSNSKYHTDVLIDDLNDIDTDTSIKLQCIDYNTILQSMSSSTSEYMTPAKGHEYDFSKELKKSKPIKRPSDYDLEPEVTLVGVNNIGNKMPLLTVYRDNNADYGDRSSEFIAIPLIGLEGDSESSISILVDNNIKIGTDDINLVKVTDGISAINKTIEILNKSNKKVALNKTNLKSPEWSSIRSVLASVNMGQTNIPEWVLKDKGFITILEKFYS